MTYYETSVKIAAPVRVVWEVTTDVESWPSWSPTMGDVTLQDPDAAIAVGASAVVRQPKLRPATWVVDEIAEDRMFSWHTSGRGYRIVADHRFDSPGEGRTHAVLTARMEGPLARILWLVSGRTIRLYLDQEAAALKEHCEQR